MTSHSQHSNGHSDPNFRPKNGRQNGVQHGQESHTTPPTAGPSSAEAGSHAGAQGNQSRYPLSDTPEQVQTAGGRTLDQISLEALARGEISSADLQIGPETLLTQARIARDAGFRELADNLTRAAELTAVPNQELLRMYEMLRPHRSTYTELNELAHTLETTYNAQVTAAFVREAAQVYQTRKLLRRE